MKIDYRKEAIPIPELKKKEMIGKIVVIKTKIYDVEELSPKLLLVDSDTCFPLFSRDPVHIDISYVLACIYSQSIGYKKIEVYLRGQVFLNKYGLYRPGYGSISEYITIRPARGIPFIVGDEQESFGCGWNKSPI